MKKVIILIFFVFSSVLPQQRKVTFDDLLSSPFYKKIPSFYKWVDDENYILTQMENGEVVYKKWNVKDKTSEIIFKKSDLKEIISDNVNSMEIVENSEDFTKFLLKDGKEFYFVTTDGISKKLNITTTEIVNPTLSKDFKILGFTCKNNLFAYNIQTDEQIQITFDGNDIVKNGYASWVYYEEILGRASNYRSFYLSPNSEKIAFLKFDDSPVPTFTLFKADGIHGELEVAHYPKAGDNDPKVWLGIYDFATKKTSWIDSSLNNEKYIAWIFWSENGDKFLYQTVDRSQENLNFILLNTKTNSKKTIYSEHQNSWVEFKEDVSFLGNDKKIAFISDFEGTAKVYIYDENGKKYKDYGNENLIIQKVVDFDENGNLFCEAFEIGSTETHFYKISSGNEVEKLTQKVGTHSVNLSPNREYYLDRFSSLSNPTQIILTQISSNQSEVLFDSKSEKYNEFNFGKTEEIRIKNRNGIEMPAICIYPPDFDKSKKYPILFDIYGGPGYSIVKNRASRWMYNYYLAAEGIIVLTIDNSYAGHYGKKQVEKIHRNLGNYEIYDFIDAAKEVRNWSFIDTNKIGITGGSYGGYATLLALTLGADYFTHGVAEFAVTDFQLYDNVYTERSMDKPSENPEGYKFGSVMNHADKLKGKLLITSGTMDDNVHYQNTLQLIEKLQILGKEFEIMIYPNERHGYRGAKMMHGIKNGINFWFREFNIK